MFFLLTIYLWEGSDRGVSDSIRGHMFVQRHKGDCIKGKGSYKLEVASDLHVLLLWNSSRHGWWIARSRRRFHLGPAFPRTRDSSSGLSASYFIIQSFNNNKSKVIILCYRGIMRNNEMSKLAYFQAYMRQYVHNSKKLFEQEMA